MYGGHGSQKPIAGGRGCLGRVMFAETRKERFVLDLPRNTPSTLNLLTMSQTFGHDLTTVCEFPSLLSGSLSRDFPKVLAAS